MERASSGVKFTGRVHQTYRAKQLGLFGELTTQGFLDGQFADESKIIVQPELFAEYRLGHHWVVNGGVQHFQKTFQQQGPSYAWTDFQLNLAKSPVNWLKISADARVRYYRIDRSLVLHFREARFGGMMRYTGNTGISMVIRGNRFLLSSKDYPAFGQSSNSTLQVLDKMQSDRGYELSIQAQYTGKIITGAEAVFQQRQSNSVIAEYQNIQLSGYISGRISNHTFYHVAIQLFKKDYAHPKIRGAIGYRDPEQPTENRLYCRVEQQLSEHISIFGQMSYLKNETLVNQIYYNKTVLELGSKFSF